MPAKKKQRSKKLRETNARAATKKAYQLERFSKHRDYKEINALKSRAYKGYMEIADEYFKKGKNNNALGWYEKALPHASESKREALKNRIDELEGRKSLGNLLRKHSSTFSIAFLVSALMLVSSNLTGFAVGEAQNLSRWAGVATFIIGLIFSFIYIRAKK